MWLFECLKKALAGCRSHGLEHTILDSFLVECFFHGSAGFLSAYHVRGSSYLVESSMNAGKEPL